MPPNFPVFELLGLIAAAYTLSSLRIIKQYERGVSFFLGRYWNTKGPGLKFLPTFVAHMHRVSLRVVAVDTRLAASGVELPGEMFEHVQMVS